MLTQAMRVGWPYGSIPSSARRPRVGDPYPASATADSHALAVRSREPSVTRPTICAVEKSCARKITSVQPSGEAASNSSARRRVAGGLRLPALRRGLPTDDIVDAYGNGDA